MKVTVTMAPFLPLLSLVLWTASVASVARGGCLVVKYAATRREGVLRQAYGQAAVTCGLISATLFSVGTWQFGALFAVAAAGCAVLWRRERKQTPKRAAA